MKKGYKKIVSLLLFLFIISMLCGCSKGVKDVSNYKYDGSTYSESDDYKDNRGYKYFLENNSNQEKLYKDAYLRCVDFSKKKINLTKSDYSTLFLAKTSEYNLTLEEMREVFYIFVYENPMFYFLSEIDFLDDGDYISLAISKDYYKYSDREKYNKKIDDGLKEIDKKISSITDDFDKVEFIYNYIKNNMTYCEKDDSYLYYAHNILGFFDNKEGVCESNSEAFYLLCKRYGIECSFAYATDHVWNIAKIYDMWYMFDLTFDFFGYSEALYFIANINEIEYDDLMIPLPTNFCDSSLSYSEYVLYENDEEIYRSHSIDDVYKHFNGGDYKLLLDSSKRSNPNEKIFYMNSFNDNYNTLLIIGTKYPQDNGWASFDGWIILTDSIHITKDAQIRAINVKSYDDDNPKLVRIGHSIVVDPGVTLKISSQMELDCASVYEDYDPNTGKQGTIKSFYELYLLD